MTHAAQRMQSLNFFLVATAFLLAAYAQVIERRPPAAAVIALLGAWTTSWFMCLERRTRQLVDAGRAAMRPLEQRLARGVGVPQLEIVASVERVRAGFRYRTVISAIHWGVLAVFVAGLLYALYFAVVARPEASLGAAPPAKSVAPATR
jgi:hypothetical protein